jgi:hypothetical protein
MQLRLSNLVRCSKYEERKGEKHGDGEGGTGGERGVALIDEVLSFDGV